MINDTRILIIGASGYIGSSIVDTFTSSNLSITGSYFSNNQMGSDSNKEFFQLDIKSDDSIDHFLGQIKKQTYDSLIFCSSTLEKEVLDGMNKGSFISNMDSSVATQYIEANSTKLLRLIKGILPLIKSTPYSNIIFLGSLVGKKALNAPPAFSIGKSCINGLVESLSKELGPSNIKVNSVDPGMLEGGVSRYICDEDKENYITHCALSRFGTAKEVANICHFLVTKNTFITGRPFVLDGAL